MTAATLTSKGQTTIPKAVRDRLGLKTGDRLDFIVTDEGTALMVPAQISLDSLEGMLTKPARPVSLDDMDAAIQESAVENAK